MDADHELVQYLRACVLSDPGMKLATALSRWDAAVNGTSLATPPPMPEQFAEADRRLAEQILMNPEMASEIAGLAGDRGARPTQLTTRKIWLIKEVRAAYQVGLKEAKLAVELCVFWQQTGYFPEDLRRQYEAEDQQAIASIAEAVRSLKADAS